MKSYCKSLFKIANNHTEERIILNWLYIYLQIKLVPSPILYYLWIATGPDSQLLPNEAFLPLYTNIVCGDILRPEFRYSTESNLFSSHNSIVKTGQSLPIPSDMNKQQFLKVFLVVFWWRNILDILGLEGKGNLHTAYKLGSVDFYLHSFNKQIQVIIASTIQIINITINHKFIAHNVAFFMELWLLFYIFLSPTKPPQSSHQCYLSHEECDPKITFIPISRIPKPRKSSAHSTRTGKRYTIVLKYPLALTNDISVMTCIFCSL